VTDNRLIAQGVSSAVTTYTYYPVGTIQNYTYSTNSVQTAYTYDTLNRLKTMGSTKGSTGLSNFTYAPYPAGNVHTVAELSGRTVNYGYDNDYHLQSETITADPASNNGAENYTYDSVGNRLTLTSTIPSLLGSISYSYDANDRLSTDTYDNSGNTTSSGGNRTGFDPVGGVVMQQIPRSSYSQDFLTDNDAGQQATGITHSINLFQPVQGTYQITMTGLKLGTYNLLTAPFATDGTQQAHPLLVHGYYGTARLLLHVHVRRSVYRLRGPTLISLQWKLFPSRTGRCSVVIQQTGKFPPAGSRSAHTCRCVPEVRDVSLLLRFGLAPSRRSGRQSGSKPAGAQ
jgi:hypothetical protein